MSKHDFVKDVQKALIRKGFNPGPIDGKRGKLTDAAITAFKLSKGLRGRPYLGPITLGLLGLSQASGPAEKYDHTWMREAALHLGLREIPGKNHNPTIARWSRELGAWWTDDETPWCGTFVAHCLRASAIEIPKHWYRAKAYAKWGRPVRARVGAVAVFGRRGGGHVGFVVGESRDSIYVLGGNQRNEVNISPIEKARLINNGAGAFRWPESAPLGIGSLPKMAGGHRTTNES